IARSFALNRISPTTTAPSWKVSVRSSLPSRMYSMVTVKKTGLPMMSVEAYTWVESSCRDPSGRFCRFHRESPRILTSLDSEVSVTVASVMDPPTVVSLVIANFRSCILPACILMGCDADCGNAAVSLLPAGAVVFPPPVDGLSVVSVSGTSGCREDASKTEGEMFNPDCGDLGATCMPTIWFATLWFPYASLYVICMFRVVRVPAAASDAKTTGFISSSSSASNLPMLNVGLPTITSGTDLEGTIWLALPVVAGVAWAAAAMFATTRVAGALPSVLIAIPRVLAEPGETLTTPSSDWPDPSDVTACALRIAVPVSLNGTSMVVDLVSSGCPTTT